MDMHSWRLGCVFLPIELRGPKNNYVRCAQEDPDSGYEFHHVHFSGDLPKRWNMFFLLDDRQAGGKFILNDLIRALTFFRLRQGLWNNQTGFQVTCEHSLDLFFILDYVFK